MAVRKCIGVVVNLNSKRNKNRKYTASVIRPILREWGEAADTASLDEMEKVVDNFMSQRITYLGISGGDGTLQKVLTYLIDKYGNENVPRIIPLAGGSTNAIVRHMHMRVSNPVVAMRRFMDKFMKDQVKLLEVPLLKIEDPQEEFPQYGFTFANGTVYKFIKRYLENGKPGIRWVFREIMQTIGGIAMDIEEYRELIKPDKAEVVIEGKIFPSERLKASVATPIPDPFPGLTPFRGINKARDEFYYVVSDLDVVTALRNAHNILWGLELVRYSFSAPHWRGSASEIRIKSGMGYIIDGELFVNEKWREVRVTRGLNVTLVYT